MNNISPKNKSALSPIITQWYAIHCYGGFKWCYRDICSGIRMKLQEALEHLYKQVQDLKDTVSI